jgi:hypothetical protein
MAIRPGNQRRRSRSARAASATKRRDTYLVPAIVSALGTTLFAVSPLRHRRDSGSSSGGTPQLVFSRMRSCSTGTP